MRLEIAAFFLYICTDSADYMDTSLSTVKIEQAILRYFDCPRQNVGITGLSWGLLNHEADVAILSKSHYLTEVEIKRSLADFKADFKKGHHHDDDCRVKKFYYCVPDKIVDKVMKVLNEKVEDGTLKKLPCVLKYNENCGISFVKDSGEPELRLKDNRPLTDKEVIQFMRLAAMRLYDAREKWIMENESYTDLVERINEGLKIDTMKK